MLRIAYICHQLNSETAWAILNIFNITRMVDNFDIIYIYIKMCLFFNIPTSDVFQFTQNNMKHGLHT